MSFDNTIDSLKRTDESQDGSNLRSILLSVAILIGFIFVVSLAIYFINDNYGLACSCKVTLPIIIAVLTSLGVFVGILTYYFLSKSYSKEKQQILGNIEHTLDFLEHDNKVIVLALIRDGGEITQSNLADVTGINAVKLHRKLANLESKGVVRKEKNGMTNKVILNDSFKELFIQ
ncbi:MAG: helix-turn-helix transcriptional regulator [Candidatus Woesearchaeota archaeon]